MYIFAILLVLTDSIFGSCVLFHILNRYQKYIDYRTIIAIGSPLGILVSSWVFFILEIFFPLTCIHGLIHILFSLLMAVFLLSLNRKKIKLRVIYDVFYFMVGAIFPSVYVSFLIYYGLFYNDNDSKGAVYGDMPFHLNIISSFVHGCNSKRKYLFDMLSPYFSGTILAYPFIPDYYSAVIIKCFDTTFHTSLILPSFVMCFSLFTMLYSLTYVFAKSDFPCVLSPFFFVFGGGTGFIHVFQKIESLFYVDFCHNLPNKRNGTWMQPIIHVVLPQRSSLFSLPIVWGVIFMFIISEDFSTRFSPRYYVAIGLLISVLPQVQGHALIALFQWCFAHCLINIPVKIHEKMVYYVVNHSIIIAVVCVFGLFQLKPYMGRAKSDNFFTFSKIWSSERVYNSFFKFWWNGLGIFIVIALLHGVILLNFRQFKLYIPSLFVFILANFILYQPWNHDNNKVVNASFLPLAIPVVANFFSIMFKNYNKKILIIIVPLFIFSILSGFLANHMAITQTYPIFYHTGLREVADFVIKNTDIRDVWLTDNDHSNPITCFAGRQILIGYDGWMASHNIIDATRYNAKREALLNPDSVPTLDKYNVKYICQRKEKQVLVHENSTAFRKIVSIGDYSLFSRTA